MGQNSMKVKIKDLKVWDIFTFPYLDKVYCVYLGGGYYFDPGFKKPLEIGGSVMEEVFVVGRQVEVIF